MTEEVIERLARIETKLDLYMADTDEQDKRLRTVERGLWTHTGGMVLLTPMLLFLANKLGLHVGP